MIKTYREKTNIKAERFDGSQKSAFGYKIVPDKHLVNALNGNPVYYFVLTGDDFEDSVVIEEGDWIVNDETDIYSLDNESFKNKCEQLPVIPRYVSEFIRTLKSQNHDIWYATHYSKVSSETYSYMEDNSETFVRAWLDGYQVEAQHDTRAD
ncbi:hypothetical protein LbDm2_2851 [Levilactobacillus brevis]|uniref:DUF1642 domain-containing protein n=1 Tax=Levilactobacillus brevis TaxID=1580 RepID=UPI000582EE68|nr:DUF1642 domain-containing protein [Levilactobacillus brevis]KID41020.1 hypothetical protein LbDm2_2851 [Levilactobacillus brevis]